MKFKLGDLVIIGKRKGVITEITNDRITIEYTDYKQNSLDGAVVYAGAFDKIKPDWVTKTKLYKALY